MELFARFSYTYPAGNPGIKDDDGINEILNKKLIDFLKAHSIKEYRILSGETTFVPKASFGPGIESVQCAIYIAYQNYSDKQK
jgi:hypothetical protein